MSFPTFRDAAAGGSAPPTIPQTASPLQNALAQVPTGQLTLDNPAIRILGGGVGTVALSSIFASWIKVSAAGGALWAAYKNPDLIEKCPPFVRDGIGAGSGMLALWSFKLLIQEGGIGNLVELAAYSALAATWVQKRMQQQ